MHQPSTEEQYRKMVAAVVAAAARLPRSFRVVDARHFLQGYYTNVDPEDIAARDPAALAARWGVTRLALFGSTARGTARADSDIDLLVSFDGPATSERYFGVQFFLEDLLGRPVDLVTDKALRPELKMFIEKEAVHV